MAATRKACLISVDCEPGRLLHPDVFSPLQPLQMQKMFPCHCLQIYLESALQFKLPASLHPPFTSATGNQGEQEGAAHTVSRFPHRFQISFLSPSLIPSPSLTPHFRRPLPRVSKLRTYVFRDLSQPVMVQPPFTRPPWGPLCSEETGYSLCLLLPRGSLLCDFSKFRKQSTAQGDGECRRPPTWR